MRFCTVGGSSADQSPWIAAYPPHQHLVASLNGHNMDIDDDGLPSIEALLGEALSSDAPVTSNTCVGSLTAAAVPVAALPAQPAGPRPECHADRRVSEAACATMCERMCQPRMVGRSGAVTQSDSDDCADTSVRLSGALQRSRSASVSCESGRGRPAGMHTPRCACFFLLSYSHRSHSSGRLRCGRVAYESCCRLA